MRGQLLMGLAICAIAATGCGKSLECGKGTVESDGECVAAGNNSTSNNTTNNTTSTNNNTNNGSEVSCGPGTELDDQSRCIVSSPTTCGAGTMLDANSGECIVTDMVCGTGTAFDDASGSCLPTDAVCAAGTTFDAAMGMCMPDVGCRPGDVVVGGLCVPPVEALIANADISEMENNDPNFGGAPDGLVLPTTEGSTFVAAGTIDAPSDLDNDGNTDQDVDYFTFTGTAGQYVNLIVQPLSGTALGFEVTGPNGYRRESFNGLDYGAGRGMLLREDGEYVVKVAPVVVLKSLGFGVQVGSADDRYALTLELAVPPTPTDVDFGAGQIARPLLLTTNLLQDTGYTPGNLLLVELDAGGAQPEAIFLDGSTVVGFGTPTTTATVVPPSGNFSVFVDWVSAQELGASFWMDVSDGGNALDLGTLVSGATATADFAVSDDYVFISATVPAGHVLEFTQTNDANLPVDVQTNIQGGPSETTSIASQSSMNPFPNKIGYAISTLPGGRVLIRARTQGTSTNLALNVKAVAPTALGALTPPATISEAAMGAAPQGTRWFYSFSLAADTYLDGILDAGMGDVDFRLILPTGDTYRSAGTPGGEEFRWFVAAGDYYAEIRAFGAITNGWTLDATLDAVGGTAEAEPNDDMMTANAGLDTGDVVGRLEDPMDVDWYSFTVATTQVVTVTADALGGFGSFPLAIVSAAGDDVATHDVFGPAWSVSTVLEPGNYFVRLLGGDGDYLLGLDLAPTGADLDDAGMNDTAMTAQAAAPVSGYEIAGVVLSDLDQDWYQFTLAAAADFYAPAGVTFYDAMQMPIAPAGGVISLPMGTSYMMMSGFTAGGPNEYRVVFQTPPTNNFSSSPALPILDPPAPGMPAPVVDTITVPNGSPCLVATVQVSIDITHTYRGDLEITLENPAGTVVQLWDNMGGGEDNLLGIFPITLTPFASLDAFIGEAGRGDWTLTVRDTAPGDQGTLNSWGIGFDCQ